MRGPSGEVVDCHLNLTPTGGTGSFIPTQVGMHEVCVRWIYSNVPIFSHKEYWWERLASSLFIKLVAYFLP